MFLEQDAPLKKDQTVGHGIMPDYEVYQSYEDFLISADTQMKFVLKLIEKAK